MKLRMAVLHYIDRFFKDPPVIEVVIELFTSRKHVRQAAGLLGTGDCLDSMPSHVA